MLGSLKNAIPPSTAATVLPSLFSSKVMPRSSSANSGAAFFSSAPSKAMMTSHQAAALIQDAFNAIQKAVPYAANQTSLPTQASLDLYKKYVLDTYARPNIVFVKGSGVWMWDADNKKYLDFYSGIAVNALGHAHPAVTQATLQSLSFIHASNLFHSEPALLLAKQMVESTCFASKAFFSNSGTEANEGALKFARKWGRTVNASGAKNQIVAFKGGFHGRTMGALSATHNPSYQEAFAPLIPHNVVGTFNDMESAAALISDATCGVIIEPIQGEGGIYPAKPEFLKLVRDLCNKHNALLIFDEIQCGVGRTGTIWAHQLPVFKNVLPDVMTVAKPLANGFPIGAILIHSKVADIIKHGDHGTTFGGGPAVCHIARAVFETIHNPEFLANVRETSQVLLQELRKSQQKHPELIADVRGTGLMVGVEIAAGYAAKDVQAFALQQGLIVITAGKNVLRLVPPLVIRKEEVLHATSILEQAFEHVGNKGPAAAAAAAH